MVVHTLPVFQETRELSDFQKFETFFRRSQLRNASCTRRRKRKLENDEKMRDISRYIISFAILTMLFYISSSSNGISCCIGENQNCRESNLHVHVNNRVLQGNAR